MERKKILVAFGDVIAFTNYSRRGITPREDKDKYTLGIYAIYQKLAATTDYYVKYSGDGVMILLEMEGKDGSEVCKFLEYVYKTAQELDEFCRAMDGPKVRFRVAYGSCNKLYVYERSGPGRRGRRRVPEYVDYPVSVCARLLEVYANEHLCIMHEHVFPLITSKTICGIITVPLDAPELIPRGIDSEDVRGLRSFHFPHKIISP